MAESCSLSEIFNAEHKCCHDVAGNSSFDTAFLPNEVANLNKAEG